MNATQCVDRNATKRGRATLAKAVAFALTFASLIGVQHEAAAGDREQAKRMYDRLTGTPPSPALLDTLTQRVTNEGPVATAMYIMDNTQPHSSPFYSVTLKNFATPWTNRDQTVFAALNDYTATVIGMVRDNKDFRGVLSDDILYVGTGTYSTTDNNMYANMEANNADLRVVLQERQQSSLNGLPTTATAGVMTSRAGAEAFFIDGTNRAMFRFTMMNHLCRDMEQIHDTTRPPDRIRQDVTRSPGGDSSVFLNNCVGCHNVMDSMAQAFAYYDFDESVSRLVYTPGQVQPKYLINSDNFKPGYVTPNDSWENRMRLPGQNTLIGWAGSLPGRGEGAKSMGTELASSEAFAQCQVEKVFRTVCFRSPVDGADRSKRDQIVAAFKGNGYNMKTVFAETAAYCAGN
ncbi:hypothetical protein HNQ60_002526 [Povalibacter uvarum]|uniref:DUF1585 domain-containing protein n=1 Tax=Povalibacter uvarum TaxID=732238 RepID=A0A841HNX6_9GAMM|nr:hypothetical protein [Povalibacter uvarum]MBB6093645.1 hypothetical protein [Povalibacter uvarum]